MIPNVSPSQRLDIASATKALRRAAKRALELGIKTGTPVYVMEKGRIVDIAKRYRRQAAGKKVG